MATVSDDDIIRRRLLIEGDGGNDDKRLGQLLKNFLKWAQSPDNDEESMATYQKMLAILGQCEYTMEKTVMVYEMNLKEQKHYEELSQKIEEKIKSARQNISECKNELQEAKKIRKHRQEYDALAKVIQNHPDRQDTKRQLSSLDDEIKTLTENQKSLENKLDLRRKQFHVLISAIHELQSILEADEKTDKDEEEMEN